MESGTLQLFKDGTQVGEAIPVGRVQPLAAGGTPVDLPVPVEIDQLRFTIESISGYWWWEPVAALNEIEAIGRSAEPFPSFSAWNVYLPVLQRVE